MELFNFSYAGLSYEEEWVNRYDTRYDSQAMKSIA